MYISHDVKYTRINKYRTKYLLAVVYFPNDELRIMLHYYFPLHTA